MAMRYIRNGTDIADDALVGRTCDNDQTRIRMCLQRPLHFGWCEGTADSKTAFHRWQQKVRRNAAQLQDVYKRQGWTSTVGSDPEKAQEMRERFTQLEKELKDITEGRAEAAQKVLDGEGETIKRFDPKEGRKDNKMENIEIRAFQKFIAEGTLKNLTVEERAGLTTSGSGAVMPVDIYNRMITDSKYSDLLSRATEMCIRDSSCGVIKSAA